MDALAPDPNDTGSRDLGFHELYTRWLQYAAFLPVFRSHGTDAAREAWRFAEPFYSAIVQTIRWRYRLLPYIYSLAASVTRDSHSIIRAVALEFPHDPRTYSLTDQFFFGSLLVCPVVEPMLYGPNSAPIADTAQSRTVYLPEGANWFNFWTSTPHRGGQFITAAAPLDNIPVFARAGSIIPLGPVMQYADALPHAPCEIRVYTGADADFTLYEDSGDSYDYEQGAFAEIGLHWHEAHHELSIAKRRGTFPGMVAERRLTVIFISQSDSTTHTVLYKGEAMTISATKSEKQ
jgi:alpha-D-xyloside xylohydrolase